MAGFIEGVSRDQTTLFPEWLDDWIGEDHLVRVVDLFVDQLDLPALEFQRHAAASTGRPGYHPAVLLKLFIYGYLNRVSPQLNLGLNSLLVIAVLQSHRHRCPRNLQQLS